MKIRMVFMMMLFLLSCSLFFQFGCTPTAQEEILEVIIDWENINNPKPFCGSLSVGGKVKTATVMWSEETIKGKIYYGIKGYCLPETEDKNLQYIVQITKPIFKEDSCKIYIRIYTSSKAAIYIKNFEAGILKSIESGKEYAEGYIFEPGNYHLEAFKMSEK